MPCRFRLTTPPLSPSPESFVRDDGPLEPHSYYRLGSGSTINASIVGFDPSPKEHEDRITAAISTIQRSVLEKIVLARSVDIQFNPPVDPWQLPPGSLINRTTRMVLWWI